MSKWAWIQERVRDARARGDVRLLHVIALGQKAWSYRDTDPAKAQALYEESLRVAKQLGDPWWVMYYTQRKIQARMLWDKYCDDALGLAVASALEARKPQYASYPRLFIVFLHLILAYVGVDPAGYADAIRQALRSLEQDVPRFDCDDFLLEMAKRWFALGLGDLDAAEQSATRALGLADSHRKLRSIDYHLTFVYQDLCGIDFQRGDWQALADHAVLGEETSKRSGEQIPLAECQLWRALLLQQAGNETQAQALRFPALARMVRLKRPPTPNWFNALCAWSLQEDDLPAALRSARPGAGDARRPWAAGVRELLPRRAVPAAGADGPAAGRGAGGGAGGGGQAAQPGAGAGQAGTGGPRRDRGAVIAPLIPKAWPGGCPRGTGVRGTRGRPRPRSSGSARPRSQDGIASP